MKKLQVNKNDLITFSILLILSLTTIVILDPIYDFIISTIILIVLVSRAKFSLFSELSIILWYSYLQGVLRKTVGITGNTLAWAGVRMPFYFDELTVATMSYLIIGLAFVLFTDLVEKEKKLYLKNVGISFQLAFALSVVGAVLILLVFPSIPTFKVAATGTRRTQGLSSLYGLVLASCLLCGLSIDQSFKHKSIWVIYAFNIFWCFGHAERVEQLGFLSYFVLKFINHYDYMSAITKMKKIKNRKWLIIGIVVVVLAVAMWLGITRDSDSSHVDLATMFFNFLQQGTCGDVVYVFNCATDLWKSGHAVHGLSYLDYLTRLIPGAASPYSAEHLIASKYEVMGGILFFGEPMMNFGIVGVIIMNVEFWVVMKILVNKGTRFRAYIWIPIVIEIFRTAWYGRGAWLMASVIEAPLLYFVINYVIRAFNSPKKESL